MADKPYETVGPLLDAIGDPLIVVDRDIVTAANLAAKSLLGRNIGGARLDDLLSAAALPSVSEGPEPVSTAIVGLGGPRRHWEMRVSRLDSRRRLVHLIDRTAIAAAERMRVDFVANASHELRTPITAISGFAETLADDAAGGDRDTRHRFVAIIAREARRMHRLIDDLLSLSRIEADRHVEPRATTDLSSIVRDAAKAAAEQRMPRGADLEFGRIDAAMTVRGDAAQLAQLTHNLVSNSFKYGRAGSPVTVTLVRTRDKARLEVRDEGEGIAAEHLPRITQRFYRVDTARSRVAGGTGLGLAIVKHIVERHGGRLEIRSEPGVGTAVVVVLPLARPDSSSNRNATVTLA